MKHSDLSQQSIVFINSPLSGFRKTYLIISTPLLMYGIIMLVWGDILSIGDDAATYFLMAFGFAIILELTGQFLHWSNLENAVDIVTKRSKVP